MTVPGTDTREGRCVLGFWASLFGGQNQTLNNAIPATSGIANWATNAGESNVGAGTNWMQSILSGDQAKIAQALSPAISAQQNQVSQAKNQIAQFGNRSGGTSSAAQSADAAARGNIINLIGSLQSGTAANITSVGSNLLDTGLNAFNASAGLSQQRIQNWQDSILGRGLTTAAAYGEATALGA